MPDGVDVPANIAEENFKIGIRPEYIQVFEKEGSGRIGVKVDRKYMSTGGQYIVQFKAGNSIVKAKIPHMQGLKIKDRAWVNLPSDRFIVFNNGGVVLNN